MADDTHNSRVTTQQFYEALLKNNQDMHDMEIRLINKIDCLPVSVQAKQIETLEEEVKTLRKRSNTWDFINSIGMIASGIVGSIFGNR